MNKLHALPLALLLTSCMVGPSYHVPPAAIPAHYKELPNWAPAAPADAAPKGDWWTGFDDPLLDRLEPQVQVSNQTVLADYAAYQQARALVQEAEGQLFPTLSASGSVTRSHNGGGSGGSGFGDASSGRTESSSSLQGTASWELDLWGQLRRQVQQSAATAQASQATLANATLSEQAQLATDIIDLRIADADIALLRKTVTADEDSLHITENQGAAGTAAPSDVITARTQLEGARSSLINAGVARAETEHAIAVLVGQLPEALSIPETTAIPALPAIPVAVPSTLLQRRPDIAADERAMDAANAAIGIAVAAYYPTITLSASGGFSATPIGALFNAANQVWSLGTDAALDLFEGGARTAAVAAAKASYNQSVATYRGTVLAAFQQVEDQLSSLRILARQAAVEAAAVSDAEQQLQIALNEYKAGTADYTTVVTAQTTLLADQQTQLGIVQNRLLASVTLIEALGGGWSASRLSGPPAPDILP